MHLDLRPFLYLWVALAAIVAALFGWRQILARREDDSLHVLPQEGSSGPLVSLAPKIEQIDKWGKLATIAVVVYGLILGALYIYQGFTSPGLPGA
jgi:hypothetical protein